MLAVLARLAFLLTTSVVLVAVSEAAYWPVALLGLAEGAAFYAVPTFVLLWTLDRVGDAGWAPAVLAAALYGVTVEGVMVPILYEGGPLDPFLVIYPSLAWHAPLAALVTWLGVRVGLLRGGGWRIAAAAAAFGLVWGAWWTTWHAPDAAPGGSVDPAALAATTSVPGFAGYAFAVTAVVIAAHALLARGVWRSSFRPGWAEGVVVAGVAAVFLASAVLPRYPWAPLKLAVVVAPLAAGLVRVARHAPGPTVLEALAGTIAPATLARRLPPLLAAPVVAVLVYAALSAAPVPPSALREGVVAAQSLGGAGLVLAALLRCLRPPANARAGPARHPR
jgi:hypothetical protein